MSDDEERSQPYKIDRNSLRPLFETFESPTGPRCTGTDVFTKTFGVTPPEPVLSRAVADGVMFRGLRHLDHDGWVNAARSAAAELTLQEVASAFVGSLFNRRFDLRSAFASYLLGRVLRSIP